MLTNAPRGTKDVLPSDVKKWQYIENFIRKMCSLYCFNEIRTPTFEHTELVQRGVGEETDIVQKEMYTFNDRGGRSITLKPEGTAPAVRSFIENGLYNEPLPCKLYYITPIFRYERPQAGRLREHHQFGVEAFGSEAPSADAEVISLAMEFFRRLGIDDLELNINSIGCRKCRKEYNDALKEYLRANYDDLCDTCKDRFERNPLRILDCKNDGCREIIKDAPKILDYLCDNCRKHFDGLKAYLDMLGYRYRVNPMIVRGLDYYTRTVFEIISNDIGAQWTVCGGGRYDGLIEECGGPDMPAVGFGMGIERLLLTLEKRGIRLPVRDSIDIFIAAVGEDADLAAFRIVDRLRRSDVAAVKDETGRSLKGQLKYANKLNAKYVAVLGDDEINAGKLGLKNMATGGTVEVPVGGLVEKMKEIL